MHNEDIQRFGTNRWLNKSSSYSSKHRSSESVSVARVGFDAVEVHVVCANRKDIERVFDVSCWGWAEVDTDLVVG